MRYVTEFRQSEAVQGILKALDELVTRPWSIMEICGGQTHAFLKYRIDELLPEHITLLHGPGCPVCVTEDQTIDRAIEIAHRPDTLLCSFGDMLRVPGTGRDLLSAKAEGADVRIIYSPLDAVTLAEHNPDKTVVLFAIGFETTAPATALAIIQADERKLKNFYILNAHVRVPPAIELLLSSNTAIDGFLAAGHVCTVMGTLEYFSISQRFHKPIVVTGFEPFDLVMGLYRCLELCQVNRPDVINEYTRSVRMEGNHSAQVLLSKVFRVKNRNWRGLGMIPKSGLALKGTYRRFDAEHKFDFNDPIQNRQTECISGEILQGRKKPPNCPAFASRCTPEHPLGATMVSSEGACAAYYRYKTRFPAGRTDDE